MYAAGITIDAARGPIESEAARNVADPTSVSSGPPDIAIEVRIGEQVLQRWSHWESA